MYDNWIACIVVLLFFLATLACSHNKTGGKKNLYIKDRNLVIHTVMSDADNASINCPGLEVNKENVHITLYKETVLHFTDLQKSQVANTSMEKQKFIVHVRNNTVDYVINMLQVNDTGLYNCTVAHGDAAKTIRTFLLVTEPGLQSGPHEGRSVFWLLLAAGCGLLALYNFITTIVSCSFA
ncbi:uncharacterized protein LOC124382629 isoform X2 [Silurus meridionalis]|nr:uncharacterized protein LOC124382629 isoform X2 [Silurus meridionalis]